MQPHSSQRFFSDADAAFKHSPGSDAQAAGLKILILPSCCGCWLKCRARKRTEQEGMWEKQVLEAGKKHAIISAHVGIRTPGAASGPAVGLLLDPGAGAVGQQRVEDGTHLLPLLALASLAVVGDAIQDCGIEPQLALAEVVDVLVH